jgi:hypothetical protein
VAVALLIPVAPNAWADGKKQRELRQQRHHAAELAHRADRQADTVAASRQRLARLGEQARAALEDYRVAREAADGARERQALAEQALAAAQQETAAARAVLDEIAASSYRSLSADGPLGSAMSLVDTGDPQVFLDGVQLLGRLGDGQQQAVDDLRVAENQEHQVAAYAQAAAATAIAAETRAQQAKQRADDLVAQQRTELAHQRELLEQTRASARSTKATIRKLEHQIAVAQARAAARALGAIPACNGGSVEGYPNGQLPMSALCPLWGAPGEMLRADAAAAFNRMSKAFSSVFGTPLCVTSSYRTYDHQAELYATMPPGYAAPPGTSNHGWGVAVDLCGGIQVDGSAEHQWLLSHAGSYRWIHPDWAMPGGAGPHEPWHWEYVG